MSVPAYPVPADEAGRQRALERYGILDSAPERFYDDASALAAAICGTPIAMVSLIDNNRQWYKAKVGVDTSETHRKDAFCAHTIMTPDTTLIVSDAALDERFSGSTLVIDNPHIRFYAGAPLVTPEGFSLGALCVIDTTPREITPEQTAALESLARTVSAHLEQRRHITDLERYILEKDAQVEALEDYQRELEEASTRYREESLIDPVTGGPNRRACELHLADEHERAIRYETHYSLLMLDLDNFKDVNDLHGHSEGDTVLAMACRILQTSLRPSDFLGRLGGDEFVAILPHTDPEGARIIAERMRRGIYTASWTTAFPVTVSIGIAYWKGGKKPARDVLARADEALYLSKNSGRNTVSGPHDSLF